MGRLLFLLATFCLLVLVREGGAFRPTFAPATISNPRNPGGICMNKTQVPADYLPSPTCLQYIDYDMVYIDRLTLTRATVAKLTFGSFLTPECLFWDLRLFCIQTLRPCYEVIDPTTNQSVAVGSYSCRTVCDNWVRSCAASLKELFAQIGASPEEAAAALECDPPWLLLYGNTTGYQVFPNATNATYPVISSNNVTFFDVDLPIYCGVLTANFSISYTCPGGFHLVGTDACTFDCPIPLLSDSEFDAITIMTSIMGWLSLTATGFLLVTMLLDPGKREYPSVLAIFFIICVMYVSFSFCLASMIGWRDLGCADEFTFNYYGDPGCTIQGLIYVYFTLASVLWWLVMAFNLFLVVVVGVEMRRLRWLDWLSRFRDCTFWGRLETLVVCYHIICWTLPIVVLIIGMANEKLGYGQDLWCTIHSDPEIIFTRTPTGEVEYSGGDPANTWNLLLLTVPILVAVSIGVTLLIVAIIVGAVKTGWRFFVQQWRLFCFLAFYVWIYVFVFSFQIHSGVVADDQYSAYADYLNCLVVQQVAVYQNRLTITCDVEQLVSFPLWFIVVFNEASQGLMVFFIFGSQWRLFKAWYRFFRNPLWVFNSNSAASTKSPAGSQQQISGKRLSSEMLEEVFSGVGTAAMSDGEELESLDTSDESSSFYQEEKTSSSDEGSQEKEEEDEEDEDTVEDEKGQ